MMRLRKWCMSPAREKGGCLEEPTTVRAALGAAVENVVTGIRGALLALGCGAGLGQGSCVQFWSLADGTEVPEGTLFATPRLRGGTGDLQLRLDDGSDVWCSARHCRPIAAPAEAAAPAARAPQAPLEPTAAQVTPRATAAASSSEELPPQAATPPPPASPPAPPPPAPPPPGEGTLLQSRPNLSLCYTALSNPNSILPSHSRGGHRARAL